MSNNTTVNLAQAQEFVNNATLEKQALEGWRNGLRGVNGRIVRDEALNLKVRDVFASNKPNVNLQLAPVGTPNWLKGVVSVQRDTNAGTLQKIGAAIATLFVHILGFGGEYNAEYARQNQEAADTVTLQATQETLNTLYQERNALASEILPALDCQELDFPMWQANCETQDQTNKRLAADKLEAFQAQAARSAEQNRLDQEELVRLQELAGR